MYADQVEAESNRSVKDRLNVNNSSHFVRRMPLSGKRQREDDKWEHDLFEDGESRSSNRRVGERDLRLKLQRKSLEQAAQGANASSSSRSTRDLREKLSGTSYTRSVESGSLPLRPKPIPEVINASRKSIIVEPSVPETKKLASAVSKKKTQQNVESLDNFLRSLDLSKYSITFQAEEVDMTTLVHMSDEDLKALGIPMGPRKKILLALESKV